MTLAETTLTTTIIVLVLLAVVPMYLLIVDVDTVQISYNQLSANNTRAMDLMLNHIRNAVNVETSATINSTEYTTDEDTLVLKLPSLDLNGDVIADTYDQIAYYLDPSDSTLLKSDTDSDPTSTRVEGEIVVSEYVSELTFHYNNTTYTSVSMVEITLTNENTAAEKTQSITSQSSAIIRNQ